MTKLIEDESKYGIYTISRRVGHIVFLAATISLAYHVGRHGTDDLNWNKCIVFGFLVFAWFIVLPGKLFIDDPKYSGRQMKHIRQVERAMCYYVWPVVLIVAFGWLALTSWTS